MSTIALDSFAATETVATRLPIFGRDDDERIVLALLADPANRMITITGPGGVGKTRFALQVARTAADRFPGGVAIVSMAAVREANRAPGAILHALDAAETGSGSEIDAIAASIGEQRTLLVLDNMEQIVEAGGQLAALITLAPALTIMVTSRICLRLAGEIEYPLRSISTPLAAARVDAHAIAAHPAVQLFTQRARAIRSDFAITNENAETVAEICRRLDGLPLAIELAAARIKVLSPQALLSRLTHSLSVLTGGPRDAPTRLQSMRDAIGWSYALLDPELQRFFRQIGVFSGGVSLTAAEAIADPSALDLIATLVDHSLVVPLEHVEDEPRFGMLETIREYAVDALRQSGEMAAIQARHAGWFAEFSTTASRSFFTRAEAAAMDGIARDLPNVRAALQWLIDHEPERAARTTYELWYFFGVRGHYREGLDWVRRLDPARPGLSAEALAGLDLAAGFLNWALGEYDRSTAFLDAAIANARARGDAESEGIALFGLGSVHRDRAELEPAERVLREGIAIFTKLDRPAWLGFCYSVLGSVYRLQQRFDEAIAVLEQGLAVTRAIDYPAGFSPIVDHLGDIARERGDLRGAIEYYRQTLPVWLRQRDSHGGTDSLAGFAVALYGLGDLEGAARLLGAVVGVYEGFGFSRSRYGPAYKDEVVEDLRARLGEERFDEIWSAGKELSLEAALLEAIDYLPKVTAVVERPPSLPSPSPAPAPAALSRMDRFGLTSREVEILDLLLSGNANAEIGERLSISPRTVGTHVANIYGKVGVSSRAALVAAVLRTDA